MSELFPRPAGALSEGRFIRIPTNAIPELRRAELARIIKFGIMGTDMPGHEYLSNSDVASLVRFMTDWPLKKS